MLESFQANVNSRKKGPGKGDAIEGWFLEDLNANRYISNGASSKNNIEGLKKVISESLYKQNLIMASSDDENSSLNRSHRGNSPGIIAKLMGLKETPRDMERFRSTNRDAKERNLSSLRDVFDLERMPRVRKEKLTQERVNPNQRALLDITDTMQFKGLLRNQKGGKERKKMQNRSDKRMAKGLIVQQWQNGK